MTLRIIIATILGAFIAWAYVSITWFFLPVPCSMTKEFKNTEMVGEVLIKNAYYDGIYILPNLCENTSADQALFMFAALKKEGIEASSPLRYIYSIIIQLVGAFILSLVLLIVRDEPYFKRALSGFFAALTASIITIFIPDGIWWAFSLPYLFFIGCNLVIGWTLASLIMALFIKPIATQTSEK